MSGRLVFLWLWWIRVAFCFWHTIIFCHLLVKLFNSSSILLRHSFALSLSRELVIRDYSFTQFTFVYYGWPIKTNDLRIRTWITSNIFCGFNQNANKLPKIVNMWREKYYVCPKFNREHDVNLFINWWEFCAREKNYYLPDFFLYNSAPSDRIFIDCNTWG